jgi:hypothetical protein
VKAKTVKAKTLKAKTVKPPMNIVVELLLPDGCMSMYIGEVVKRDAETIVLTKASWIACTGRRHAFFAGQPDNATEIEPYPDNTEISLPARGAIVTSWDNPLPRLAR